MRTLAKALIVMTAISGLALMGCDNGSAAGATGPSNGTGGGGGVIAEQYRGTFEVENVPGGAGGAIRLTIALTLDENTVTRTTRVEGGTTVTNDAPFPAWTEGNRLYGRPGYNEGMPEFVAHIGTFTNANTLAGQGFILGTHTYIRVPQE